jgi:CRP-like cAMP-binding protein
MTFSVKLEDIPFLKEIPKPLMNKLAQQFQVKIFKKDTPILTYNDPVDSIYLILKGSVEILTHDNEERITILNSGSVLGEVSLFLSEKRATANAKAFEEECTLLVMPKKVIEEEILIHPDLAVSFYRGMCGIMADRLYKTNRTVTFKITELKKNLKNILEDHNILKKFKETEYSIENLGSNIFASLADVVSLLDDKNDPIKRQSLSLIEKTKKSLESILLKDLQMIDRISQKLKYGIQFLENIERTINNQKLEPIKGDKKLFDEENYQPASQTGSRGS